MNAKSDEPRASEPRGAARAGARKRLGTRGGRYLVAAVAGQTEEMLAARLHELGGVEILRTLAPHGRISPPVAVVQTTGRRLRRCANRRRVR